MARCLTPEQVEQAVQGNLPPRQQAAVQEHAAVCPDCKAALDEARANDAWAGRHLDDPGVRDLQRQIEAASASASPSRSTPAPAE